MEIKMKFKYPEEKEEFEDSYYGWRYKCTIDIILEKTRRYCKDNDFTNKEPNEVAADFHEFVAKTVSEELDKDLLE